MLTGPILRQVGPEVDVKLRFTRKSTNQKVARARETRSFIRGLLVCTPSYNN